MMYEFICMIKGLRLASTQSQLPGSVNHERMYFLWLDSQCYTDVNLSLLYQQEDDSTYFVLCAI